MKKILFLLICFCLFQFCANGQILKGGVSEEYIPEGFFGTWGVISKLKNTNNYKIFNLESKDIWALSGYSNVLILENFESGAISQIEIKEKTLNGKTLKFQRQKTVQENNEKIVYMETVSFTLNDNKFSGIDNFVVKTYDKNNTLIEKSYANYIISGVRISGKNP